LLWCLLGTTAEQEKVRAKCAAEFEAYQLKAMAQVYRMMRVMVVAPVETMLLHYAV
jgi:hypothetical protein